MGKAIIKVSPDEDFYVVWSSVIDGPTHWGTREEVSALLFYYDEQRLRFPKPVRDEIEESLTRADAFGSSAMSPRSGPHAHMGWLDNSDLLVYHPSHPDWNGPSLVRRTDLRVWCESDLKDFSLLTKCEEH